MSIVYIQNNIQILNLQIRTWLLGSSLRYIQMFDDTFENS